MWIMPSYGRPHRLKELFLAVGGWPDKVTVLLNEDDPTYAQYVREIDANLPYNHPWRIVPVPAGSHCADAHRYISEKYPNEPFYGLLMDDLDPCTLDWHHKLVAAAGNKYIAIANGDNSGFPHKFRGAGVLGGDLVRAMGNLVPLPLRHHFEDDVWDDIAKQHNILRPVTDAVVHHRHHIYGTAPKDDTYDRSQINSGYDHQTFQAWLLSKEREEMHARIGKLFPENEIPPAKVCLLCPVGGGGLTLETRNSIRDTAALLKKRGHTYVEGLLPDRSNIGIARESLLWDVWYAGINPTHLLWVDADMAWQPEDVLKLLSYDYDIVNVPGRKKQDAVEFCGTFFETNQPWAVDSRTGCIQMAACGFAFTLMKFSVVQRMIDRYPSLKWYNDVTKRDEWALFMEMIGGRGTRLSEDLAFCERWRQMGGDIWFDPSISLAHVGKKAYFGRLGDYLTLSSKPEAA